MINRISSIRTSDRLAGEFNPGHVLIDKMQNQTVAASAIDAEIERLQSLKARHAKVAAGLREYLKTHMLGAGIQRIDCPLFSVSLRNNPASVDVFDAEQIPADYWHAPEPKPAIVHVARNVDERACAICVVGVEHGGRARLKLACASNSNGCIGASAVGLGHARGNGVAESLLDIGER